MADSIIDGTNIDTTVFSYSAPKAHASGGKVVNLYNKHFKESLTLYSSYVDLGRTRGSRARHRETNW